MPADPEAEAIAVAFGAAVRLLRQEAGISLNELARRAGVDPAYIHRIEARRVQRPPLPRRAVVRAIAAALGSSTRQTDHLLALAGHAPGALLELGGWDQTLAAVAELLSDASVSAEARADFQQAVLLLARRWMRSGAGTPKGRTVEPEPGRVKGQLEPKLE